MYSELKAEMSSLKLFEVFQESFQLVYELKNSKLKAERSSLKLFEVFKKKFQLKISAGNILSRKLTADC